MQVACGISRWIISSPGLASSRGRMLGSMQHHVLKSPLQGHYQSNHCSFRVLKAAASSDKTLDDDAEQLKLSQVAKRLEQTGKYFKRLGNIGFWSQLCCIVVSAGITAFSAMITSSKATSSPTFYLNVAGIAAGFVSVFWSFGYLRLGNKLRTIDPKKAPPRAEVVGNIKNGVMINLVGMCSTLLGLQATVGVLVAKALTSSATPVLQSPSSYSPVLALDVFLVQAAANAMLSHFLGLVFSLELLRSVTLYQHT